MIRGLALAAALTAALAAALTLGGALPAAAGYQEGLEAFQAGDYAAAHREFHPLAQEGHPDAQFALAQMYRFGAGVPQDDAKAFAWFLKAGENGHVSAQGVLGFLYAYGSGTEADAFQAYVWFSLAATEFNSVAEANRDKAARLLSAAQRAEADRLVAERLRQANARKSDPATALSTGAAPTANLSPNLAPGTFRVQLGAFRIAENAPALWRRLRAAQPDLLGGLGHRIQRREDDAQVFHLLQVGPLADAEEAKALCAALNARGVDCMLAQP